MRRRHLSTMRLGVRLTRRELWRRKGRTLLVVLMVLVPTAGMTLAVTFLRTSEWTSAEHQAADSGRADATATPSSGSVTDDQLVTLTNGLPVGSETLVERSREDAVAVDDGIVTLTVSDLDLGDPITSGRFGPLRGRLPRAAGEVVTNDAAARLLDTGVGGSFTPDRMARSLEVVGTVRTRGTDVNEAIIYVPAPLGEHPSVRTTVWIDLPDPARGRDPLSGVPRGVAPILGWELVDQGGAEAVHHTQGVLWTYLGGAIALVVAATVIAAAFAIGARRQLRTIGLLACSGASPATTKAFLVVEGAIIPQFYLLALAC